MLTISLSFRACESSDLYNPILTSRLFSFDTSTGSLETVRNKGDPNSVGVMDDASLKDLPGPAGIRIYEYAEYCSTALPKVFSTVRLQSVSNVLLL